MRSKILRTVGAFSVGVFSLQGMAAGTDQKPATVDPVAVSILYKMTSYMQGLEDFSVQTNTTLEDLLDSGQRVDFDVAAISTIRRPNKIRAQRTGGQFDQIFYYNGKTLTLFNPDDAVYATQSAPGTIEELLDFARMDLGLTIPIADLVYRNAYAILMKGVTSATVIGQTTIEGVHCDHLAFRQPGVDFQLWVASGDQPLPCKYAVTDTSTPALLSTVSVTSDWNLSPNSSDAVFDFVPPEGATAVSFLPADNASSSE